MNNFKKWRLEAGISQNYLSSLLNISQSVLSNYETGKRQPSLKVCYKFIKILKLKNIDVNIEDIRPE